MKAYSEDLRRKVVEVVAHSTSKSHVQYGLGVEVEQMAKDRSRAKAKLKCLRIGS